MLIDIGKPRKTCVDVTCRTTLRILTSRQQSGILTEGTGTFTLNREAAIFSETSVNCYHTTRQYIVFGSMCHTERQFVTLPCLPVNIEHVCTR